MQTCVCHLRVPGVLGSRNHSQGANSLLDFAQVSPQAASLSISVCNAIFQCSLHVFTRPEIGFMRGDMKCSNVMLWPLALHVQRIHVWCRFLGTYIQPGRNRLHAGDLDHVSLTIVFLQIQVSLRLMFVADLWVSTYSLD